MADWIVVVKKPQYNIRHTRGVQADTEEEAFQKTVALIGGPNASEYVLVSAHRWD